VDYIVLPEATFERLYRGHRQPTEATERLSLPECVRTSPGARVIPAVPLSLCAGHFDGFPALPLAIVLRELVDMSGELVAKPHWVDEAFIEARDLCWAGQAARFEASLEPQPLLDNGRSRYECRALSGARSLADLDLLLSPPLQ
jgi:hypothetical protein